MEKYDRNLTTNITKTTKSNKKSYKDGIASSFKIVILNSSGKNTTSNHDTGALLPMPFF